MKTAWLHTHLPRLQSGETPDVISVKVPGQRIAYASWVSLRGAEFKVSEHGRQRCIREGVRNVHAWVVGDEILRVGANWSYAQAPCPTGYRQAVYDPFRGPAFVNSETLEPVLRADLVIVAGKRVFYADTGVEMTDQELAALLASRRKLTEKEVARRVRERDLQRGPYVPHAEIVHHTCQESRH